ncbi:MAG: TRAP transporter substrate-binding protein [Gammaproteobacteria bacterium]|nr:TRAP transporter substrate-binding protein [Gammaproteobacteria bacterium]
MPNNIVMTITQRSAYTLLALLLAACGNGAPQEDRRGGIDTGKIHRWKMVTTWPANFPVFQEAPEMFAKNIRVMSNGRLDINVFAGGELVPALQVFDAVSQGAVEMGHGSAYYWAGKVPAAQFFSTVPFGMEQKGVEAWLYHGGGLELWNELYEPFNVIALPIGNSGVQMGGWFNKKIETIADLKGLRMRIPGLGGKVLDRAGGNPILMSAGEVYTALERGTIDATEWVGPLHDLRLGLNRAARYYYYPGWHEPGAEMELLINRARWDSLPADLQQIVKQAAAATGAWTFSAMEYHNSRALKELSEKKNVQMLPFPQDVLQALRSVTRQTLESEAEKDPEFKRVYESYLAFQDSYQPWHRLTSKALQTD